MQDKETGSEWSHLLGEAKAGPLAGKRLTILPSVMTNWESWSERHPHTTATLLEPTDERFRTEMLHRRQAFGLGLVRSGKARFWRFDHLHQQPLVNDRFVIPLVVFFDPSSLTPVAWRRQVGERELTFRREEQQVRDEQTDSAWDLIRGEAIDGPLQGTKLEPLPAIVSFTRAWDRFHPESTYWQPE